MKKTFLNKNGKIFCFFKQVSEKCCFLTFFGHSLPRFVFTTYTFTFSTLDIQYIQYYQDQAVYNNIINSATYTATNGLYCMLGYQDKPGGGGGILILRFTAVVYSKLVGFHQTFSEKKRFKKENKPAMVQVILCKNK